MRGSEVPTLQWCERAPEGGNLPIVQRVLTYTSNFGRWLIDTIYETGRKLAWDVLASIAEAWCEALFRPRILSHRRCHVGEDGATYRRFKAAYRTPRYHRSNQMIHEQD